MTAIFFLTLLNQNQDWDLQIEAYKFTGALTFFSVYLFSQILDQTWEVLQIGSITLPSLNVFFEAIILSFLISGLWDIWMRNS